MEFNDRDVDVLARTLWGEARGEQEAGRYAVAWVIRNRAERRYGGVEGSAARACLAPWQFSCWNLQDPNRQKMLALTADDAMFRDCLRIARDVLANHSADQTGGADHYHTLSVHPDWADSYAKTVVIGHHVFYNSRVPA